MNPSEALSDESVLHSNGKPVVAAKRCHPVLRRGRHARRCAPRRDARRRSRQADSGNGPFGLREVDAHAHPRRARQADVGHRVHRRHGRRRRSATRDLTKLRRKHIGFVFQFFNLLPMLSAEENVRLPLTIAGTKPDKEFFEDLLQKVGLTDRRSHRPSELSGGQQQRVAIARALVSQPTVVFADEPTGNLDSATSGEILDLMRASVDELGQTTVMVTHDPARRVDRRPHSLPRRRRRSSRTWPAQPRARSSPRWTSSRCRDARRPQGPLEPQAPDVPHRLRDRARRGDDHRHVCPHGLDLESLRLDLQRRSTRAPTPSSRVIPPSTSARIRVSRSRRSTSLYWPRCERCPKSTPPSAASAERRS